MNFLYCFDIKYNKQAFNSISSILRNADKEHTFFIIHKQPKTFDYYLQQLQKSNHDFHIFEFQNNYGNFPRVSNTHVSEATYYRLFIDEYIPEDVDFLTYIDADIVCLNNPTNLILEHIKSLKESSKVIAARTEEVGNKEYIERLSLKQNRYFNAGVMIMDFNKWKELSSENKFVNELNNLGDKVLWWDQDILNATFDGDYIELNINLNFPIHDDTNFNSKEITKNVNFLHYQGKNKPWFIYSFQKSYSKFYQEQFKLSFNQNYHIIVKKPIRDSYKFLNVLIFEEELKNKIKFIKVYLHALLNYFFKK